MVARRLRRVARRETPLLPSQANQFRHARRRPLPREAAAEGTAVPASADGRASRRIRPARQSCGVHSGASNASDLPRQHRKKATLCGRAGMAARERAPLVRGARGRDERPAVAPMGGKSGADAAAARLLFDHASPGVAQVRLRHVACGLRHAAGTPGRCLRHLPKAVRPHAVRRSLPRYRMGARTALQQMQSRHGPLRG
jgi:hypothetical protein